LEGSTGKAMDLDYTGGKEREKERIGNERVSESDNEGKIKKKVRNVHEE
jgi:hypothetical protein